MTVSLKWKEENIGSGKASLSEQLAVRERPLTGAAFSRETATARLEE